MSNSACTCAPSGSLAHDVVEHVRGRGRRAVAQHVGGSSFDDLDVEIGGGQLQLPLGRLDHHIGEDRDRVAPFDDALDMAERLQKGAAFDVDFHRFALGFRCFRPSPPDTVQATR